MWKNATMLVLISLFLSCKEKENINIYDSRYLPKSRIVAAEHPQNNSFTTQRLELGKLLFYDPILSLDSSISCNSCHKQEFAFADNVAVSNGVLDRKGIRNSPSLGNIGLHPYFTREGGVPSLEQHVLVPIQEKDEMAFNIVLAAERLESDSVYTLLCNQAYPGKPIYYAITASLAQFQRTFVSGESNFDAYLFDNNKDALSDEALRGLKLFYSDKTNCFQCHSGSNFTNYTFENNGLYKEYSDDGRYRLTKNKDDLAKFKVASLRNVDLTSPYMHDGSLQTLEQVMEHYNTGGNLHKSKSEFVKPLGLTNEEKRDLVEFLKSLTDEQLINNEKFKK